jgi:hypothetical protein
MRVGEVMKLEKCPVCGKLSSPGSCKCGERVIKPISYSMLDLHERELLRHIGKQGNYSRYVKRLIERDMLGG